MGDENMEKSDIEHMRSEAASGIKKNMSSSKEKIKEGAKGMVEGAKEKMEGAKDKVMAGVKKGSKVSREEAERKGAESHWGKE